MNSLSVVLPAHNEESTLPKQLAALEDQYRFTEFDMVLFDDSSSDNTYRILSEFKENTKIKNVQLYRRSLSPLGPPEAYNEMVKLTQGDWLYLAAADDEIQPGAFLAWRSAAEKWDWSCLMIGDVNEPQSMWSERTDFLDGQQVRKLLTEQGVKGIQGASVFIRKDVWQQYKGYDPKLAWYSDLFLYHMIAMRYGCVYLINPISDFKPGKYSELANNKELDKPAREELLKVISSPQFENVKQDCLKIPSWRDLLMDIQFVFVTVLWGQQYTKDWFESLLPLQIPQLKSKDLFVIWTDPETAPMILINPIINEIEKICEVHVIESERLVADSVHTTYSHFSTQAIKQYAGENKCLVLLSPDVAYGAGSWDKARARIYEGYKAVTVPMFRVKKRQMIGEMKQMKKFDQRALLNVAFKHLHPLTESLFWEGEKFNAGWPSHLYWKIRDGILGRCYHQQPFMVMVPSKDCTSSNTPDADLLTNCGIGIKDIHVMSDSDEFCAIELTDENDRIPEYGPRTFEVNANWAKYNTSPIDKWLFSHLVKWHGDHYIEKNWIDFENESERVCSTILKMVKQ